MLFRARIATLFLSLFLVTGASAQFTHAMFGSSPTPLMTGAVSGTVLGPQGEPWAGVRVELSELNSLAPVDSTFTQQDGSFEFFNVPSGNYRVIAYSNASQARDVVSVQFGTSTVRLRFPNPENQYGDGATISIAQMMVPAKARNLYRKAREALAKGNAASAQSQLEKALQICPLFAEALVLRGIMEWRSQQSDRAQLDLEQAIRIDPGYSPAYLALGDVYNAEGRFDDALRTLERAVAISPMSWQGYFEMAKASIGKGMFDQGLQWANKSEKLGGGGFAPIHLLKAYAMVPLKFYKGAREELQNFLSHEPKGQNAERAQQLLAQINAAELADKPKVSPTELAGATQ